MKRLVESVDAKSNIESTNNFQKDTRKETWIKSAFIVAGTAGTIAVATEAAKYAMHRRQFLAMAGVVSAIVGAFIPEIANVLNPLRERSVIVAESIVRMETRRQS